MSSPIIFGTQTLDDLADWLVPAVYRSGFDASPPQSQLYQLADYAHALREYRVRDACFQATRTLGSQPQQPSVFLALCEVTTALEKVMESVEPGPLREALAGLVARFDAVIERTICWEADV